MHPDFHLISEIAITFAAAAGLSLLLLRFKVPLVLSYIGTGLVLGPAGLGLVAGSHDLTVLAEVGVALLLFTLGLEFSIAELRRSWRSILLAGAAQVGVTVAAVTAIARVLGLEWPTAITWGFLVSLSSTAVVLRLLDVRGETKAAHGRLVVGVLVFQDLAVIGMLLVLPILGGEAGTPGDLALTLGRSAGIILALLAISTFAVPPLLRAVARSRNREVFLLSVLAIAGGSAFATAHAGLSLALGAFLAGMAVAGTHFAHQALSDVLPLRSSMMCLFFVTIGLLIDPSVVVERPGAVAALVAAVMVGKFALMVGVGLALRVPFRVAALAGAALAQVGEFSFVLAGAALGFGLLSPGEHDVFLAASVLTLMATPLFVQAWPRVLAGTTALLPLGRLVGAELSPAEHDAHAGAAPVLIIGLGVGGRTLAASLEAAGEPWVGVELNAETVRAQRAAGKRAVYGDATSPEILAHAGLGRARAVAILVGDVRAVFDINEVLRTLRPELPRFARTRYAADEAALHATGAVVISEERAGAADLAVAVLQGFERADAHDIVDAVIEEQRGAAPTAEP